MARLLRETARSFPRPGHVITDLGGEFTGTALRRAVARLGAHHRTASAENLFTTARLERSWRTLKELAGLYRLGLPLTRDELERRLLDAVLYYVGHRPHEGLGGATPLEAFLGPHPRGRRPRLPVAGQGSGSRTHPPQVAFLDPARRRFPTLRTAA
jgi:transposase InsO family protein